MSLRHPFQAGQFSIRRESSRKPEQHPWSHERKAKWRWYFRDHPSWPPLLSYAKTTIHSTVQACGDWLPPSKKQFHLHNDSCFSVQHLCNVLSFSLFSSTLHNYGWFSMKRAKQNHFIVLPLSLDEAFASKYVSLIFLLRKTPGDSTSCRTSFHIWPYARTFAKVGCRSSKIISAIICSSSYYLFQKGSYRRVWCPTRRQFSCRSSPIHLHHLVIALASLRFLLFTSLSSWQNFDVEMDLCVMLLPPKLTLLNNGRLPLPPAGMVGYPKWSFRPAQ